MKLVWNPQALDDRDAIIDYIAEENPAAAISVDEEIECQADTLVEHPELGRFGRVHGTRELVIARTQYVAVYAVDHSAARVEILRVLHCAQQWP